MKLYFQRLRLDRWYGNVWFENSLLQRKWREWENVAMKSQGKWDPREFLFFFLSLQRKKNELFFIFTRIVNYSVLWFTYVLSDFQRLHCSRKRSKILRKTPISAGRFVTNSAKLKLLVVQPFSELQRFSSSMR